MEAHDIEPEIRARLAVSYKTFSKYRRKMNGDGTIRYRVCDETERPVRITQKVYKALNEMMDVVALDNIERPFFIIFNEEEKLGVDVIIGEGGDEGSCEHSDDLVQEAIVRTAKVEQESLGAATYLLSRGHTHPVFYEHFNSSSFFTLSRFKNEVTFYGAMPSNVFGSVEEWQSELNSTTCAPARREHIENIIKTRVYKKHCDDYVESYYASHMTGFNAPHSECGSCFHWIVTPRTRQIGVFEVPYYDFGVVVYHPWLVVSDSENCEKGECDCDKTKLEMVHAESTQMTDSSCDECLAKIFWCTHPDCTESVDSCFADQSTLSEHMISEH